MDVGTNHFPTRGRAQHDHLTFDHQSPSHSAVGIAGITSYTTQVILHSGINSYIVRNVFVVSGETVPCKQHFNRSSIDRLSAGSVGRLTVETAASHSALILV